MLIVFGCQTQFFRNSQQTFTPIHAKGQFIEEFTIFSRLKSFIDLGLIFRKDYSNSEELNGAHERCSENKDGDKEGDSDDDSKREKYYQSILKGDK